MTTLPLDIYDCIAGDVFLLLAAAVVWKYMLPHSYHPSYKLLHPQKSNSSRKFEFSVINLKEAGLQKSAIQFL